MESRNYHPRIGNDGPQRWRDEPLNALIGTLAVAGLIVTVVITVALLSI